MAYLELEAVKQTLDLTGETYADADLTIAVEAAASNVESICGRRFNLDTDEQTRSYRPRRPDWLEIDDLAEPVGVEYGTVAPWTAIAVEDYDLLPYDAEIDGQPYTAVQLRDSATVDWTYEPDTIFRVTGKFGWPEVPKAITHATTLVAIRLLKRAREAPFGVAGIGGDGVAVRVSAVDPDVASLLEPYIRPTRLV